MSRLPWRWLIFWNWESLTGQVRSLKLSISCFRSRWSGRPGALGEICRLDHIQATRSWHKPTTLLSIITTNIVWVLLLDLFYTCWTPLTLIESDDTWCIVCDMSHCVCQGRDWQPGPCPPAGTLTLAPHTHGRAAKQSPEFHFRLFPSLPWTQPAQGALLLLAPWPGLCVWVWLDKVHFILTVECKSVTTRAHSCLGYHEWSIHERTLMKWPFGGHLTYFAHNALAVHWTLHTIQAGSENIKRLILLPKFSPSPNPSSELFLS